MNWARRKRAGYFLFRFVLLIFPLFLHAETVEVIGTSDLHGDLERFAHLATVIRRRPDAVKVDAGDLVQGNFVCDTLDGVPMIEALNLLRYDLWVPGNHDFELGISRLRCLRRKFNGEMAGAQWHFDDEALPAWKIITRNGIRCAFIALTEPKVALRAGLFGGIIWRADEHTALKKALKEIRSARADAVILVFHASLHGSYGSLGKLLYDNPGIDAVLCAHTHQEIPGTVSGSAVVAQPGHRAGAAVLFRLFFENKKLHHVESSLLRPDAVPDPEIRALWLAAKEKTCAAAHEDLGVIESEDSFCRAAAEAIRRAAGSDAALTAFGTIFPGPLDGSRFFGLMPYRNRIIVIECGGKELLRALKTFPYKRRIDIAGTLGRKGTLALSDYLYFSLALSDCRVIEITPLIERDIIRANLKKR